MQFALFVLLNRFALNATLNLLRLFLATVRLENLYYISHIGELPIIELLDQVDDFSFRLVTACALKQILFLCREFQTLEKPADVAYLSAPFFGCSCHGISSFGMLLPPVGLVYGNLK